MSSAGMSRRDVSGGGGYLSGVIRIHSGAFEAPETKAGQVQPLAGGDSFSSPDLLPNGVNRLAMGTREKRGSKESPFTGCVKLCARELQVEVRLHNNSSWLY